MVVGGVAAPVGILSVPALDPGHINELHCILAKHLHAQVWPYVKQLRQWVKQRRRQGGAAAAIRPRAAVVPVGPAVRAQPSPGVAREQEGAVTAHVQVLPGAPACALVLCPRWSSGPATVWLAGRNRAVTAHVQVLPCALPPPWMLCDTEWECQYAGACHIPRCRCSHVRVRPKGVLEASYRHSLPHQNLWDALCITWPLPCLFAFPV